MGASFDAMVTFLALLAAVFVLEAGRAVCDQEHLVGDNPSSQAVVWSKVRTVAYLGLIISACVAGGLAVS
jgi:hypothetical protein